MASDDSQSSGSDELDDRESAVGVGDSSEEDEGVDDSPSIEGRGSDDWSMDLRCKHCNLLFSYGERHLMDDDSWWSYLKRYKVRCPSCVGESDPFILPVEISGRPQQHYTFCDRLVGLIVCIRHFSLRSLSLQDIKRVACGLFIAFTALIISSVLFHYASVTESRVETVTLTLIGLFVLSVLPGALVWTVMQIKKASADSPAYEIV